jgi:hypothetical protein
MANCYLQVRDLHPYPRLRGFTFSWVTTTETPAIQHLYGHVAKFWSKRNLVGHATARSLPEIAEIDFLVLEGSCVKAVPANHQKRCAVCTVEHVDLCRPKAAPFKDL